MIYYIGKFDYFSYLCQMKIGNIVSTTKIDVSEDFNVAQSLGDIIQGLPTLIVGWDFIKKNYPNYDIIERKLDDNLYWTFKKTERRELNEEDIYNFKQATYANLIKDIKYVFIDPIQQDRKIIKKIIKKILSIKEIISYTHDNMIYLYGENVIFGIDLSLLDFLGYLPSKITQLLSKNTHVSLTKESIFIEYRKRIENLDNQVKYIPFLYSIENAKNNNISLIHL